MKTRKQLLKEADAELKRLKQMRLNEDETSAEVLAGEILDLSTCGEGWFSDADKKKLKTNPTQLVKELLDYAKKKLDEDQKEYKRLALLAKKL